jgi:membrane associated rhomboid family serine protease
MNFHQALVQRVDRVARVATIGGRAWVTAALVAVNIAVFICMIFAGAGVTTPDPVVLTRWGSNFGPLTTDGQWWRLFTCLFVHFGPMHLLLNMWALCSVGPFVEKLYGHLQFAVLYVFAGVTGGLASLMVNPAVDSVGASGAVFGVLGGLLVYLIRSDVRVPLSVLTAQCSSTLLFIMYALITGYSHPGIDHTAHFGGLLGGLCMGMVLARPFGTSADAGRRLSIAIVLGFAVLLAAALPVARPGPTRAHAQQFRRDAYWLYSNEDDSLAVFSDAIRMLENHAPPSRHLTTELALRVAPFWETASRRFAAVGPLEDPKLGLEREFLQTYVATRRDAVRHVLVAAQTGNATEMEFGVRANRRADGAISAYAIALRRGDTATLRKALTLMKEAERAEQQPHD